jgi:NAD-dependent SIR2 family protein deacetylase
MPKVRITLDGWRCTRCAHEWVPRYYYSADRSMVPPKVCPKCKSPYWDTEPARRRQSAPPALGPTGDVEG